MRADLKPGYGWCEIAERLAAYEDTGLEPEGVAALMSHPDHAYAHYIKEMWHENGGMERMEKLAKAEAEGRLLVLPCKVGDTVFDIQDGHVSVLTVESIHIWSSGAIRISAHTDKTSMYWKSFELRPEGFGKVFFLNREEAKKALAAMDCVKKEASE
jgi:hypothetical protein